MKYWSSSFSLVAALALVLCAGSVLAFQNGDFESRFLAWDTDQGWYGGAAKIEAAGEGRSGSTALKMVCSGNRGMSIQPVAAYPGTYTVSGWVKCSGISGADARVAVEWFDAGGSWIGYSFIGSVTGDSDWTHISATVSAPANTRRGNITPYVTDSNSGTAWWDDISFARVPPDASLVTNGGFESGLSGWDTNHSWYSNPPSAISVPAGEGRSGSAALKYIGEGHRAVAIQNPAVSAGAQYKVTGWIRSSNLDAGDARIAVEWLDASWGWLGYTFIGSVSGTADWTYVEQTVTAPSGAAFAPVELMTAQNNTGTVWFDDITFKPVMTPFNAPPAMNVQTPSGSEGSLQVTWNPSSLSIGAVKLFIYCETSAISSSTLPRVAADAQTGSAMVYSLQNGQQYHVTAAVADPEGRVSAMCAETLSTVSDRQAPRPGWLEAQRQPDGKVRVGWSPHVLDFDATTVRFRTPGGSELASVNLVPLRSVPRPFYCTEPWVSLAVDVPSGATQIEAVCEDAAPNQSSAVTANIKDAYPTVETAPCTIWTTPPTTQIKQSDGPPSGAGTSFSLTNMRGQAKGFQAMVRPDTDLTGAQVRFGSLTHEDGVTKIPAQWLAYHFVDYVNLDANSIYTPPAEQVWAAPADFPDELADDLSRNLPAGETQPIFIRITAPADAKPGTYTGSGWVECTGGRRTFTFTVRISPVALPDYPQFHAGQWFRSDYTCQQFGVAEQSEDGWRALARTAELYRKHHHSAVKTPWDLIRSWKGSDGVIRHDFRDFDRFIDTFLAQGGDPLFMLSHIGGRTYGVWECPTMRSTSHKVSRLDSADYEYVDAVDLLTVIQNHVTDRGLLNKFATYVADEPIAENLASYKALSARVKAAAPNLRRIDAIIADGLVGDLEIWVPLLDYYDRNLASFRAAQAAGCEMWFYVAWTPQGSYPNRLIDSMSIKPRVLHWLNGIYDTYGYLHWALNWWQVPLNYLNSPGDQYIVWPSQRYIADSSLRFEAEREGLEDWQLMYLYRDTLQGTGLSKAEAQAQMESIARQAVRAPQDYTRSWQELETVRLQILAEQETLITTVPKVFNHSLNPWNGALGVSPTTFTSVYRDLDGFAYIDKAYFCINDSLGQTNAALLLYNREANRVYLKNDANTSWGTGYAPGANVTLENGQCVVHVKDITVSSSGTDLTVNWRVSLKSAFVLKQLRAYMYVHDSRGQSDGWEQMGIYYNVKPQVVSIDPAGPPIEGLVKKTLTSVYSDPNGSADIRKCYLLVSEGFSQANAMFLWYDCATNKVYLKNTVNTSWGTGYSPGTVITLSNNQCNVYVNEITVTRSDREITIVWSFMLKSAFSEKSLYSWMYVTDSKGLFDGWKKIGTHFVPVAPTCVGVVPSTGKVQTGIPLVFSTEYQDENGYPNIYHCYFQIGQTGSLVNTVCVLYDNKLNKVYLKDDANTTWGTGYTPGSNITLENSQCLLHVKDIAVTPSGSDNLIIDWNITLKPSHIGKLLGQRMFCRDNEYLNSAWKLRGYVRGQ